MELVASFVRDLQELEQDNEDLEEASEDEAEVKRASRGRKGSKKKSKDKSKKVDQSANKGQTSNAAAKRAKENMDLRQNRVRFIQSQYNLQRFCFVSDKLIHPY